MKAKPEKLFYSQKEWELKNRRKQPLLQMTDIKTPIGGSPSTPGNIMSNRYRSANRVRLIRDNQHVPLNKSLTKRFQSKDFNLRDPKEKYNYHARVRKSLNPEIAAKNRATFNSKTSYLAPYVKDPKEAVKYWKKRKNTVKRSLHKSIDNTVNANKFNSLNSYNSFDQRPLNISTHESNIDQDNESTMNLMQCAKDFLLLLNKFSHAYPDQIDTSKVERVITNISAEAKSIEERRISEIEDYKESYPYNDEDLTNFINGSTLPVSLDANKGSYNHSKGASQKKKSSLNVKFGSSSRKDLEKETKSSVKDYDTEEIMNEYMNELNHCLKCYPKDSMQAARLFYRGFPEMIQRNLCVPVISD
ncbi:unnamed protein product [Moneuplotes crassus]|uniref:Uncharacterized protein n=1 Tax=Euplotes crassus TaxID=5936 RepID=A0AAD1Y7W3_EUPCR|nr:unnamed protein product [Moneuplotes crassus]